MTNSDFGVKYDSQGKPYVLNPQTGAQNYISPVAMGTGTAPTDHGFMQDSPHWDTESGQFKSDFDWSKLATLVAAGVLTAGTANAIMAGAGGAGVTTGGAAGASGTAGTTGSITSADLAGSALGSAGSGSTVGGLGAGVGAGTGGAGAATTMLSTGDKLANAGKLLAAFGQGQSNQRVSGGDLTQRYDQLALADQTGRNQTESDAMKKLAQTSYILGGGSRFKAPTIQLNGQTRQIQDYGLGPSPVSDAQKQGAQTLQQQLLTRLAPGGTVAPTPPGTYTNPGTGENLGNYGSLALTGLGLAKNLGVF